jgi:hypothetical protein
LKRFAAPRFVFSFGTFFSLYSEKISLFLKAPRWSPEVVTSRK